jgi:2,4'-dihydroxyacetophenone dioxygenase
MALQNARPVPENAPAAYRLPQPDFMSPDLVHLGVTTDWLADEKLWVPLNQQAAFKPLILAASSGYWVNLIRVRGSGIMSRHRHFGPVHAMVLKGRWYYLEHDWIAEEGAYVFEPPGETHTLYVPEGVPEMVSWFHVTGGYAFVDPHGATLGYEDVFTRIESARNHYVAQGLRRDYVNRFIR